MVSTHDEVYGNWYGNRHGNCMLTTNHRRSRVPTYRNCSSVLWESLTTLEGFNSPIAVPTVRAFVHHAEGVYYSYHSNSVGVPFLCNFETILYISIIVYFMEESTYRYFHEI